VNNYKNVVFRTFAKAAVLGTVVLAMAGTTTAQADYYRHGHNNGGAALAGGIFGFAAGMIAGAAANSRSDRRFVNAGDAEWVAYCARKYRSYDPRSNTFLGHDGYRHYCN